MFEIKVPEFGESIQEVQVAAWLKQPGDWIEKDEDIVELESEKASQALSSERAGVLQQIKVADGEFAHVGDILCVVEEGEKPTGTTSTASAAAGGSTAVVADSPAATTEWIMPAAERVLSEYQISADAITPTGPGGRLLKEDVLNYVRTKGLKPTDSQPAQPAPVVTPPKPQSAPQPVAVSATASDERVEKSVPMSMIRRTISKRLVEAQQTAALLTTFNEIDMLPVKELRSKYKDAFLKKHGVKLGFMSFFAKAVVEGLKRYPAINSEVQGDRVIVKNYHDIGIAIGGGKGLVVPILRNVENMSFAVVERKIGEFAALAQANKIVPDDLKGGTFTISNGGVYGSLLSTPIVNPPQSGILGLHTIQDRPIALNGEVVIRPMMYVALTYDHRIVDGKEAVGFLKTIKEVLEEPARLFLEV
ncbi:MAG: 2-oxoglutarate dehydrogenase complex dihydrolipoyllysine-residue succinyltransferase [Planctomycetaceae bacterium]|nr:2-oxoglutarate dehydrogenase complex dihydrolipoyllysine-residue succinyltransferase [Planctomycetaceae bacterium]